jgi:hypothetical protein
MNSDRLVRCAIVQSVLRSMSMFELIALTTLIVIGAYGIRLSTDTPLDRVDTRLWPFLHH